MFNLAKYFDVVGADIPALYFVYRVLSKCSASEAAAERFFSSEGAIHNKLQNRLNPDITEAVVKVRWNQEPIKRLVHSLGSELQDEELQRDEEDLVEEVEVPVAKRLNLFCLNLFVLEFSICFYS
eukprot:Em0008g747a